MDHQLSYRTVEGTDSSDLDSIVNDLISHGWKPQGGVSVFVTSDEIYWAQAMIKENDVPTEGREGIQGFEENTLLEEVARKTRGGEGIYITVQAEELRRKALRDAYAIGDWDKVKEIQDADQADWEARQKVGEGSS